MASLRGVQLRTSTKCQTQFYCSALGMIPKDSALSSPNGTVQRFTFPRQHSDQFLELHTPSGGTAAPADHPSTGCYWKCGFMNPDVRGLAEALGHGGYQCSSPHQFGDIGFMCHSADDDGMTVELLQHTFESSFRGPSLEPNAARQQTTLGQVCPCSVTVFVCPRSRMKSVQVLDLQEGTDWLPPPWLVASEMPQVALQAPS